ncbi:MAG: hypothetical protein OJF59_000595 [Cytophagales bacterium]|jgi:hypothetical protein|nr:MAG: hypothetical protein OJF59_000595 [Cytophagales bacterium]
MSCVEMTSMLNAMHRLYEKAVDQGKPYRIHRIKKLYNDFKTQAAEIFEIVPLDSVDSYEQLLGPLPELRKLMLLKEIAIQNSDYEQLATIFDQQREYVLSRIQVIGANKFDQFFCKNGRIFLLTSLLGSGIK